MRILAYELNEVPWNVIDEHARRRPDGAFARLARDGACFTTEMDGPLHPWITWPTMHRGTAAHGARFLGQAPDPRTPPIWEVAHRAGRRIGVFGALPSWPPLPLDGTGFHVPDVFAADARCEPATLSPFQAFCLDQLRAVRNAVGEPDLAALARTVPALARLGVTAPTLARSAALLADARRDPRRRYRLPVFATQLGMDVFTTAWRRYRPDYASYFTSHVAWLMHRFWRAAHPEAFPEGRGADDPFYAEAIPWGLDLADAQLARLLRAADRDPELVVVLAGSMGQGPGAGGPNLGALALADPDRLLAALGRPGPYTRGRAIEPDVPLRFPDVATCEAFVRRAAALTDTAGAPLFELDPAGPVVCVRVSQHHAALVHRVAVMPDGRRLPVEALGLTHDHTETPCTGIHTAAGVLAFHGARIAADPRRATVSALRYAPTVLGLLGVAPPPTMPAPSFHETILR